MRTTQIRPVPAHPFFAPPPRLAIAGDWHADTAYAVAAIDHAARRDAATLLHLGDFGYNFTDQYLDALQDALSRTELLLGFVDGNHENFDRLESWPVRPDGLRVLRDRIVHVSRGLRWQWGATRCLAVGGAYSIDRFLRTPGTSWWPQETITAGQVSSIVDAGETDAMFCHDCPAGITVPGAARDRYGCPVDELQRSYEHQCRLRFIVDAVRPMRLWHGHFHRRYRTVLVGSDYRTVVDGLAKNGDPIDNNMVVVDLADVGWHRSSARSDRDRSCSA